MSYPAIGGKVTSWIDLLGQGPCKGDWSDLWIETSS